MTFKPGMKVIYTPFEGCEERQKERGVVTGVTSKFVFVRYERYTGDAGGPSMATNPDDLEEDTE